MNDERQSSHESSSDTTQLLFDEQTRSGSEVWSPYLPLQVTPTMAKEKKFRDGKRKKKGLTRKQRRVAASLKEKGLSNGGSPSKTGGRRGSTAPKKKKKRKYQRRAEQIRYIGEDNFWARLDYVSWNRRRTTGVKPEELSPNTVVTEEAAFAIVETNLDVDLKLVEARRTRKKKQRLTGLLARSDLDV